MKQAVKNQKIKNIIDFSDQDTASIKSLGVKANDKVKITTRFIKGKMLMFTKTSIRSFVYDLINCFCFPNEEVQELYAKNDILKCFIYLILTDTDSCCIQFLFLTKLKSQITENQARKHLFEMILLQVGHRIDASHDFYANFLCQNETRKKQVGLYEVESVDNANVVTIAVNPKEYFEVFKNKSINKKHKDVKKSTPGMNFEAFAVRIMDIREYSFAEKLPKSIKQKRFQISHTNMQMTSVCRKQFASLNDKRYYLTDGVTSLTYGHFLFAEIREEKKQYKKIHEEIMQIKDKLMRDEHKACSKCETLRVLRSILSQSPTYYKIDSNKRPNCKNILQSTKEYILSGMWQ